MICCRNDCRPDDLVLLTKEPLQLQPGKLIRPPEVYLLAIVDKAEPCRERKGQWLVVAAINLVSGLEGQPERRRRSKIHTWEMPCLAQIWGQQFRSWLGETWYRNKRSARGLEWMRQFCCWEMLVQPCLELYCNGRSFCPQKKRVLKLEANALLSPT